MRESRACPAFASRQGLRSSWQDSPLWLSPPGVDAVESCSDVNVHETGVHEPLAHGLDGLRMVVHGGKHVQGAQDLHLFEFLIGVIELRLVRDRSDRDEVADGLADER